jgi:hypothetical protein
MTGAEIIASTIKAHGISSEEFFSSSRVPRLVKARKCAIEQMTAAGFKQAVIARNMKRCHTTIIYWQGEDFRGRRTEYYARRHKAKGLSPRVFKTTEAQRLQLLSLFNNGQHEEMYALQAALGVARAYTMRLALKRALAERRAMGLPAMKRRPALKLGDELQSNRFTKHDDAVGRELVARKALPHEYVRIMGRTRRSVLARLRLLDDAAYRASELERHAKRHRRLREKKRLAAVQEAIVPKPKIEIARPYVPPRSLTEFFFGDPPAGRSALDRRGESRA